MIKNFSILLISLLVVGCGYTYPLTGKAGLQGIQGEKGDKGDAGENCVVTPIANGDDLLPNGGAIITCGINSVLISNGSDGLNGINGQDAPMSAYCVTEIIDPCGDKPNVDDEVFLLLANGKLVWLQVDNGSALTARLALARDGSWQTTDGSGCNFTLLTSGSMRTMTWTGGSKSWMVQ